MLRQNNIPATVHTGYIKWLRYYLDFCKKYRQAYADNASLYLFLNKLKEKNQTLAQQDQAAGAVKLYYSGLTSRPPLVTPGDHVKERYLPYRAGKQSSPWDKAMALLGNEIKLRHYSPKTLKAYSLWAEKLRYHAKEKLPETLVPEDVKAFLTSLAV